MHYATHDTSIAKIARWILESAGRADDGALQPDTNLMDEDYLDSLGLMGLILFVEELRGAPIAAKDMSAQNFVSLRRIEQAFFTKTDEYA